MTAIELVIQLIGRVAAVRVKHRRGHLYEEGIPRGTLSAGGFFGFYNEIVCHLETPFLQKPSTTPTSSNRLIVPFFFILFLVFSKI